MQRRILAKSVSAGKVRLIPNFVDVNNMVPLPKANEFSSGHGLDRAFVVTYAGNMGPAQGLETILDAASLLGTSRASCSCWSGKGSCATN